MFHKCTFQSANSGFSPFAFFSPRRRPFHNFLTTLFPARNFTGRSQDNHARYKNLIALKGCVSETITALLCEHVRPALPRDLSVFRRFHPPACSPFAVFSLMYRRRRFSPLFPLQPFSLFSFRILKFDAVSMCAHAN